jgi:gluconokinase
MGVAGSGKSTVGRKLAEALRGTFLDADDFHPPANVAKMRAGQPLDDADRAPWLDALAEQLGERRGEPVVLACSALKESYRRRLQAAAPNLILVFLDGDPATIRRRLEERGGHFMPPSLLDSQLQTLETPSDALRLDISEPVDVLVARILAHV